MNHVSNYRVTIGPEGTKTEPIPDPCRCGGPHGHDSYEYGWHMCFHEERLMDMGHGQVICPLCGMAWITEKGVWTWPRLTRWQQIIEYLKVLYR